jgi:hypothetical protein
MMNHSVDAVTFHRLGNTQEAHQATAEANRLLDKAPGVDRVDSYWLDWWICRTLKREAEAPIKPTKSPKP